MARWTRHDVYAEIEAETAPDALSPLPAPAGVRIDDAGRADRVTLTFDAGAYAAVDAWLAYLCRLGAVVHPGGGEPTLYPPGGGPHAAYRAQTLPWRGYRWALECPAARAAQVVTS